MRWLRFQSTRPRGARRFILCYLRVSLKFQSTRLRGARRYYHGLHEWDISGFNPRASEGRDFYRTANSPTLPVSIHAPARGATVAWMREPLAAVVSIHAPARGATIQGIFMERGWVVSIHAPARGATNYRRRAARKAAARFNPRAREGRDVQLDGVNCEIFTFQSTRPRGARRLTSRRIPL